ncbi:kinesin-like protein KIF24 [Stegastes partitus]|uniref:Kinesin-like protein KIF24 n=1 Tax=Stegastes partitus TaxID=144197 RepID=A0A9Y4KE20_9TELE|nr:PREDICTED: kinesin-like protein KIF24 [Stegastes partitus]
MTLCLYECLRAVGLQRHYARFASVGVCRAAHLSALTMEDYPLLGIRTMQDRTRLFNLVQLVKTVDLDSLGYDDGDGYDYDVDGRDESCAVVDSSFNHDGCGSPDEDVSEDENDGGAPMRRPNSTPSTRPSRVCRRLDFSNETADHHQELFSRPVNTVHVSASHDRSEEPVQGKESAKPVQLEHQRKSSLVTMASKTFNNKPFGHKDRKIISRKQNPCTEMGSNGVIGHMVKPTPVYEAKRTAGYNYGLPLNSPHALNKKYAGKQRISVCVRKRPLTRAESRRGEADVVTTPGGECVIVHEGKEAVDLTQYILQHRFYFDQVFGEESSNEEVYHRTAYPLVQHMLSGGKATCFAYGQTGAGKTHTMLGSSPRKPGLYALAVRDIFAHLATRRTHSSLLVYVSFFEIYCGQLYDLLDHRKRLFAREDGQKVVHIMGLRDVRVDSVGSLLEVISQGTEERTQGMSGVNPLSSRSHALLQIQLRDHNQQIAGRMWFVDLAGSERASDAKEPDRQSRMEGAEINQSLLALKECIRSLDQEQSHTPFRQSKLTQVLRDSFVGDSMTCMIANISPGHTATEHTLNTLRYADRVKELRGQGGLRGRRRGKTVPSPKHNLATNSSSSSSSSSGSNAGLRGKSPPKKPKLGGQKDYFAPTTPTARLPAGGAILCSTPKNSRCGKDTNARGRKGIGLEHVTPVGGWLRMGDKRQETKGAGEREARRIENVKYASICSQSVSEQSARPELVLGQQVHSWKVHKAKAAHEDDFLSGFYNGQNRNQECTLKGGRGEERQLEEIRKQVKSRRDTSSGAEKLRVRDLQKADERDKERARHLRRYHEQLQQFIPSSTSSSAHPFSPSTSFSSSTQGSLTSSVSPSSLQHSSCLSVSAPVDPGLEEVLNAYAARVEVRADGNRAQQPSPSGEIHLQTETSTVSNNSNDEDAHSHSGGDSENWRVSWERQFEEDRGESEKRSSMKATSDTRVRTEDGAPAGMDGGQRRWAWVPTTKREPANRMTCAFPAHVQAQLSYSCDSKDRREVGVKGLDASNAPADGGWSIEQGGAADNLVSAHSNSDSNSLFNHSVFQSPHQRAPAERPLSPVCQHTNTFQTPDELSDVSLELKCAECPTNTLPLPLQNNPGAVPSSSHSREKEPWFAANANRRHFLRAQSTPLPLTSSITQIGWKTPTEPLSKLPENPSYTRVQNCPDIKDKMSDLPLQKTFADSLSSIMDPLSISLLQVDQQAATVSFLKGDNSSASLTSVEMVGRVGEDEDGKFRLSLLELPQAKAHRPATSEMAKTQTTLALGNKFPESPLRSSTCDSMQTPSMSPSVQHFGNTTSPSLHNLGKNATQMVPEHALNEHINGPSAITTQQLESVSGQLDIVPSQSVTVQSNHSSKSNISLQQNNPTQSNGQERMSNQQTRPTIPLFTLDDLDHAKWCIVEAHWEQLKEMEALCRKEGKLLCQQPDMAFGEYVHKLEEIMERKAWCVRSMRAQLQPFLIPIQSNHAQDQGGNGHEPVNLMIQVNKQEYSHF